MYIYYQKIVFPALAVYILIANSVSFVADFYITTVFWRLIYPWMWKFRQ